MLARGGMVVVLGLSVRVGWFRRRWDWMSWSASYLATKCLWLELALDCQSKRKGRIPPRCWYCFKPCIFVALFAVSSMFVY